MRGLVLAGGSGTRLRPLTYSGAKQLVPIANRPILFYVIENLVRAGITSIGVIISPETGREIRRTLGDGSAFGANLSFILQDRPGGIAHAVATARDFLAGDEFLTYLGDNLVGTELAEFVTDFSRDRTLAASLLLKAVDDPRAFGIAELDSAGNLVRLVEKPAAPRSNLALVGIYLFRPVIFDAISRIRPSARGELEITDAISMLLEMGHRCQIGMLNSFWLDTGKKDDLLRANVTVLEEWLEGAELGRVDDASTLTGRVRIEPDAVVERSTILGPAIIGRGSRIVDSEIGPHTSIGDRAEICRSRVEHSVILEEAVIRDVALLDRSVIGRRVRLCPGKNALSLMVGDDCIVELAPPIGQA